MIQINDEEEDYQALYAGLQSGPLADDAEKPSGPIKAKGEFGLDDLPPISDLTITVSEDECIVLGTVTGTVDTLGKYILTSAEHSLHFNNFLFHFSYQKHYALYFSSGRISTKLRSR